MAKKAALKVQRRGVVPDNPIVDVAPIETHEEQPVVEAGDTKPQDVAPVVDTPAPTSPSVAAPPKPVVPSAIPRTAAVIPPRKVMKVRACVTETLRYGAMRISLETGKYYDLPVEIAEWLRSGNRVV